MMDYADLGTERDTEAMDRKKIHKNKKGLPRRKGPSMSKLSGAEWQARQELLSSWRTSLNPEIRVRMIGAELSDLVDYCLKLKGMRQKVAIARLKLWLKALLALEMAR
jgi:hypothetical protein